jgi:tetrahydromethanopterin S-methyltransferase subunit B
MSPITIDRRVKEKRDEVAKLERERTVILQQIRELDEQIAKLPAKAALEQELEAARQKLQQATDAVAQAEAATTAARDAYKTHDDELQRLKSTYSTLKTLAQLADPDTSVVSAAMVRKAVVGAIAEFMKELKEKVAELEGTIPAKEAENAKLADALNQAENEEATKRIEEHDARQKRDVALHKVNAVIDLEVRKAQAEAAARGKDNDVEHAANRLDIEKSKRNALFKRNPGKDPDYLKIAVGSGAIEPAAREVLDELAVSDPVFMAHEHLAEIKLKVDAYGIVGSLLAITDLVNRGKEKPLNKRILAASYAYTLLQLIKKVEDEAQGDAEDVREALADRVGFANRIRHFQQDGLPGVAAPRAVFADHFLQAVSKKTNRPLPPDGSQRRKDLIAGLLANLS